MNPRLLASCVLSLLSVQRPSVPQGQLASTSATDQRAALAAAATTPGTFVTSSGYIIEPLGPAPAVVTLHNVNNNETETFAIALDGRTDAATAAALKHFLRCRRTHREKTIAPGTLSLLVSVAQHWPGRVIDVVSGFRAPPFGAPHSKHFVGHAIDIRVEGVKTSTLRDLVWRENHEVGVGHYTAENFVHIDWRPGEADKAWSSRYEGDELDYSPRWAWSARHPQQRRGRMSPRS